MDKQSAKGKTITETLKEIGIKRSTCHSWLKPHDQKNVRSPAVTMLTPDEKKAIEDVKEEHPLMRQRCCLAHYSNQSFSHYFDHRTIN